jgi:hypothetical protein
MKRPNAATPLGRCPALGGTTSGLSAKHLFGKIKFLFGLTAAVWTLNSHAQEVASGVDCYSWKSKGSNYLTLNYGVDPSGHI